MAEIKRRVSMIKLVLELVEQSIVLVFLEMKLAALEIKRNIDSAKTGAMFLGLGGFLLLFSLLGVMTTAIAALSLVLPVWLSALIVTAVLIAGGAALLFTGLSKMKHFTLVPRETVDRVETISHKLKKHAEKREAEEREALRREAAREGTAEGVKDAREVREAARREMTYAREKEIAKEVEQKAKHRRAA
jgi:activator of 2-hydroxyglutaryl-CoA dehydratase